MKKRLLSVLFVILITVSCVFSPVASAKKVTQAEINALKSEANALKAERQELQKQVNALSAEIKDHANKKAILDQRINVLVTEIVNTEAQITAYGELIAITEEELAAAEAEEEAQYALFCERVRAMEKQGKVDYWSVLFRATSFTDLLSRLDIINEIMRYDQRVIDDLQALQVEITDKKTTLEGQKAESESAKAELEGQKSQLDKEREEANALMRELQAENAEAKAAMQAIEDEEDAILAEAVRLSRLYEEQNRPPSTPISRPNNNDSKGGYIWPVNSRRITSTVGGRASPGGVGSTNHKGTDIGGVGYNSEVYASKAGTVIISTYSSSYGNYVVLSHSSGNTTLYAHMSSRKVSVGQHVAQGQVIGITGSTGHSTGPHLHFEITENGVRVNPLSHGAEPKRGYLSGYTLSGSSAVSRG